VVVCHAGALNTTRAQARQKGADTAGGTIRAIPPWVDGEGVAFEFVLPADPSPFVDA